MMLRAIAAVRPYSLFVVRRPDTTRAMEDELRARLPSVTIEVFSPSPYAMNRLGPLGRFPEAHLAGLPPWVRSRYSRELHDRLRARPGVGLAIGEAAAAYFPGTKVMWHWDKANVLAASAHLDIAEAESVPQRLRAHYLARASRGFEGDALALARSVSVTSAAEAGRLREHYGRDADFVLPSCVDLPQPLPRSPEPGRLVWLSSFSYRPNVLGLIRFLTEAWEPLYRAGFRMSTIGSGLTDSVAATLRSFPGVDVVGFVEDLAPVLARAQAAVVPLWSGAGVKLKTLTLLAHGVPVFSTLVGAEGLPLTAAVGLADTPSALAALIAGTRPDELDRMSGVARDLIADEFSERRFGEQLITSLHGVGLFDVAARHRAVEA
jgi:glycosyltransferase involved in cell wall biosynthesis